MARHDWGAVWRDSSFSRSGSQRQELVAREVK
jgi:hypothetical protein